MSADQSPVALAFADLERDAAQLIKKIAAMRVLDGMVGDDDRSFAISMLRVQSEAAHLCTQLIEDIQAVHVARKARANAAPK